MMIEEKKPKRVTKKKRKIERQLPNLDTLFAHINALRERIDYSKVITDPRGARKIGTDLTR
jgi:hypothetical protein